MSEYKRFISYMYEYIGDEKGPNRGFVKVECRSGVCKMHISVRGLCRDEDDTCDIYGFHRKGSSLEGTLLDTRPVSRGTLNISLQFPLESVGDKQFDFNQLNGLIILCHERGKYATLWDDESLHFGNFPQEEVAPDEESVAESPTPEAPVEEEEEASHQPDYDQVQATSIPEEASTQHPYFRDGFITHCQKITPRELRNLDEQDSHLINNRFVHYGYQMFGHLLIGELQETGKKVLCVPGSYHQQECLTANVFGFSHFKQCPQKSGCPKCFGYWYRSLHTTDFHFGDGSS